MTSKHSVAEIVSARRFGLLIKKPFLGFMVSRMKILEDKQSGFGWSIPTAATDGKHIIYNEDFFKSLEPQEITFVLAHEIMHCVLDTLGRRDNRDMQYWNMATDFIINGLLVKEEVGSIPKYNEKNIADYKKQYKEAGIPIPSEVQVGGIIGLYNEKYNGWTAEEVYQDLLKNQVAKKQTLDVHLEMQSDDPDEKGENSCNHGDKEGKEGKGKKYVLSKKELEQASKEFKKLLVESLQRSRMAGNQPGGIELLVSELLTPKINWKQLLQVSIQSMFKNDITWTRPNRRSINPSIILPSSNWQNTVDVCVSLDTSGSISDQQRLEFLSEIAGILEYYRSFKLKIWCFDTQCHALQEYDQTDINEMVNYKPAGGGGTDIGCNFDFMKEKNIVPAQLICFTDGYNGSPSWGDETYCPTTWIIHSNPNPQVPFGRSALYEELINS